MAPDPNYQIVRDRMVAFVKEFDERTRSYDAAATLVLAASILDLRDAIEGKKAAAPKKAKPSGRSR